MFVNTTTHLFICNTFISNTMLRPAKNYAEAKQHPKVELSTKMINYNKNGG